uniref:Uncharacterized protein n=1 Tax=Leptobrachium leishanense TaxID=445787 RepID=A0A8C5PFC7_9ANUR
MSESSLKARLLKLDCHFTWGLQEEDFDMPDIQERLLKQLEFMITENKYMVYNVCAYVNHLQKKYAEAILDLEKSETTCKTCGNATNRKLLVTYANFAWVYHYLNQHEMSQCYIDKVDGIYQEITPSTDVNLEINEIYGEQGWTYVQINGKYYEKAVECFQKALIEAPDDPEWNTGYATVVYRLEGHDNPKFSGHRSYQLLIRAIEVNPNDSVIKALAGLKLQDMRRGDEGLKYIEEALQQTSDLPYLLRYVGKFYKRAGMIEEALHHLDRALDSIPTSGFHHHQKALCYRIIIRKKTRFAKFHNSRGGTRELIQKAIHHFELGLKYKKSHIFAYIDLADMYKEANEYEKAEETLNRAMAITNLTGQEKKNIHYAYGRFEENVKKSVNNAIKHYREALQIPGPWRDKQSCEMALKNLLGRKTM